MIWCWAWAWRSQPEVLHWFWGVLLWSCGYFRKGIDGINPGQITKYYNKWLPRACTRFVPWLKLLFHPNGVDCHSEHSLELPSHSITSASAKCSQQLFGVSLWYLRQDGCRELLCLLRLCASWRWTYCGDEFPRCGPCHWNCGRCWCTSKCAAASALCRPAAVLLWDVTYLLNTEWVVSLSELHKHDTLVLLVVHPYSNKLYI